MTTRPKNTSPHSASFFFNYWIVLVTIFSLFPLNFLCRTISSSHCLQPYPPSTPLFFSFLLDFSSFFSCRYIQAEQQHLIDTLVIIDVWTKQHTQKRQRLLWHFLETPPHNHQCENGCLIYFSFHAPPIKWNNFDQLCTLLHSLCFTLRILWSDFRARS